MALLVALASILVASVDALTVRNAVLSNITNSTTSINSEAPNTFSKYYNSVASGRGVWKWNTALDAYQRHFWILVGKAVSIAEVGVQSGGSLLMWKNVLGDKAKLYGLDINPECKKFQEGNVDITIGDQGDWAMWTAFFAKVITGLDVLVDDGSHEAPHMLTTLKAAFPNTHAGGYVAIEDIHGTHYLESFFKPTAIFLAQMASSWKLPLVHSVHLYPTLMVVRKGGGINIQDALHYPGAKTYVSDFAAMWNAISTASGDGQIILHNREWENLFTADALTNIFTAFIDLHAGAFKDTPAGCSTSTAAVCTNEISPKSYLQTRVSGVHIYSDHVIIEVLAKPPQIAAVRKGSEWIGYGL